MTTRRGRRLTRWMLAAVCFACGSLATAGVVGSQTSTGQKTPSATAQGDTFVRRLVEQGIEVEVGIDPIEPGDGPTLEQGRNVRVHFRIRDTATGTPIPSLNPAAWLDLHHRSQHLEGEQCMERIQSLVAGTFAGRAEMDLNVYYVLALNDDSTISVVDPLFGYGDSKLINMVLLNGDGDDWALSGDHSRLFVSMPLPAQVAVIDTRTWKVTRNIPIPGQPHRLAMQPDGRSLWVGFQREADSGGVSVIDLESLEVVASFESGPGPHQIAFSDDSLRAFVSDRGAGTLSVFDSAAGRLMSRLQVGEEPAAVAYSPVSRAAYVTNAGDGTVVVVDPASQTIQARIALEPGLGAIRFAPGRPLGLVLNPERSLLHVLDAATNSIIKTGEVGERPDQVSFTSHLAYIRSLGTATVLMVALDEVATPGPLHVIDFPGGQKPFGEGRKAALGDGIVEAPAGTAVLVANPADEMIYYYQEGMAAPMGAFRNYGQQPRAAMVVDRSLREVRPGEYATTVRLTRGGTYDLAFFLDSPRITHCFDLSVASTRESTRRTIRVELESGETTFEAGQSVALRFKVVDADSGRPLAGLKDLGVLSFRAPGTNQHRSWIETDAQGRGRFQFTPSQAGVYYLFFKAPSLRVDYNEVPHLLLRVIQPQVSEPAVPEVPQHE